MQCCLVLQERSKKTMPQEYNIGSTWLKQRLIWTATVPPAVTSARDGVQERTAIITRGNSNRGTTLEFCSVMDLNTFSREAPPSFSNQVAKYVGINFRFFLQAIVSNWHCRSLWASVMVVSAHSWLWHRSHCPGGLTYNLV